MSQVDVLIVADAGDVHATAVETELQTTGATTVRFNLGDIRQVAQSARLGALDLLVGAEWSRVSRQTTVWWHRTGTVGTADLSDDEARLAHDEGPHLLRGYLAAAGVRWVDEPFDVDRAETKLLQLTAASSLGISVPESIVTNDPRVAEDFGASKPVIAKAVSPGTGIAPYVAEVPKAELGMVAGYPTLLQELVVALADLRVVVVGRQAWVWRRPRSMTTVDWRAEDPAGTQFAPAANDAVRAAAIRLTASLRLTVSVQDWLETTEGVVFLEANPQGAWLFLDQARELVGPALATHLRFATIESPGVWPRAIKRFYWDFLPSTKAPPDDGIVAPVFSPELWIPEVAEVSEAIEISRRAREAAEAAAKTAEDKASRLVQVTLALLAIALTLGAFQLHFSFQHSIVWMPTLIPVGASLVCLALAAFEAVEIDRVGVYRQPAASDLSGLRGSPQATLLEREEEGRKLARWTAVRKHSDLMQARAWFSRGLAALILAALVGGMTRAYADTSAATSPPISNPRSTTTVERLNTTPPGLAPARP